MLLLHVLQCVSVEGCCLVTGGWNANIAMPSQLVAKFWRGQCSGGSYPHQLGVTVFNILLCIHIFQKSGANATVPCKGTVTGAFVLYFSETHFTSYILFLYSLVSLRRPCSTRNVHIPVPFWAISNFCVLKKCHLRPLDGSEAQDKIKPAALAGAHKHKST